MTDTSALLRLMSWLSPVFPTGSFAYSAGLEQAVFDGQLQAAIRMSILGQKGAADILARWNPSSPKPPEKQHPAPWKTLAHALF